MSERNTWHTPMPDGLTRAQYRTLYLEPVPGSGERIAALVGLMDEQGLEFRRIVSRDAVKALFGSASESIERLIESWLNFYNHEPQNLLSLPAIHSGAMWGEARTAASGLGRLGLFRQALARCSAFGSIDEEATQDSEVRQGNEAVHFSVRIREAVLLKAESLADSFNREMPVIPGGQKIRFGFVHGGNVANFEVLRPYNRQSSVNAAQGRLWSLLKAKKFGAADDAWLVLGRPPTDSVEYTDLQMKNIERWSQELTEEGAADGVIVRPVTTIEAARDTVLELAKAA